MLVALTEGEQDNYVETYRRPARATKTHDPPQPINRPLTVYGFFSAVLTNTGADIKEAQRLLVKHLNVTLQLDQHGTAITVFCRW